MLWYFDSWNFPESSSSSSITVSGCGYLLNFNEILPAAGWVHDWTRLDKSCGPGELLHGKIKANQNVTLRSGEKKKTTSQTGWVCEYSKDVALRLQREDWVFAGWYNGTFHYHQARLTSRGWESDVFCGMELTITGDPMELYPWYVFPYHVVYRWGSPYYPSASAVGDLIPPPWDPVSDPHGDLYRKVDDTWFFSRGAIVEEVVTEPASLEYPQGMDSFGLFVLESGIWPSYGFYPSLASQCYQKAVGNLPQAECNTMANILDVIGVLKSFLEGYVDVKSLSDLASSAWLSYRYAYSTTVMDIQEYAKLSSRLCDLIGNTEITTRGTCSRAGVKCTCTVTFKLDEVLPSDTLHKLQTWGLKCSAVNLWDMVPYSFVVDWFFHISDILESMERYSESLSFSPVSVWTTFKSSQSNSEGANQECFLRLKGRPPLQVHYDFVETSSKTLLRRILDTGALLIGGK